MRRFLRYGAIALTLLSSFGLAVAADDADTGKINRGAAEAQRQPVGALPAQTQSPPGDASVRASPSSETTGAAPGGPIGATRETMPSKYSAENDAADKRPLVEPAK